MCKLNLKIIGLTKLLLQTKPTLLHRDWPKTEVALLFRKRVYIKVFRPLISRGICDLRMSKLSRFSSRFINQGGLGAPLDPRPKLPLTLKPTPNPSLELPEVEKYYSSGVKNMPLLL